MKDYELTVGLEIHAELKTRTKMFCNSRNDTNESRPNVNICPICLGYPGTLPVINKEAVRSVLRLGLAMGGEIADITTFDRKNYFYPDIPKGYQISQYKNPLVKGGELLGVTITRVHLEEDTARSLHNFQFPISNFQSNPNENSKTENSMKIAKLKTENSFLDFNRAGVPLVELVTEPIIHDPETAAKFAREFQLLLIYLGIATANMEKGEMRVEANISVLKVRPLDSKFSRSDLGTKVEVKNLNSFKSVEKAIRFEFDRQTKLLEQGEKIIQETRGWDEIKEETVSQRAKEKSHDYRYFPDPDLPKLFIKDISDFAPEALRRVMPELPWQKRERYKKEFGLKNGDIEVYIKNPEWGSLFEETAKILGSSELAKLASNYITSDIKKLVPAENLAKVILMLSKGGISSRGAKDILKILEEENRDPEIIAREKNLVQESDREVLKKLAEEIVKEHKDAPVEFLVGQAMKKSNSKANPIILKELFKEIL
ncbi:MAG: Asp-tRNA(Asn)/Glu-tRNA(Gln) amidotransferase subunit GatB [Candidatus Zambryskibacteria bacterium]|nr:Asp-tRNA(Asn)/Glu-tRNA(Gln) amidotransferase subunit GatB [Candidatus Zambryskibacteria bacterium]